MRRALLPLVALIPLLTGPWLPVAHAEDARVLMLGNSYVQMGTMDERLALLFPEVVPSWSEVRVRRISRGGYTLAQHAMEADGSNGDTEWRQALVTGPDAGSWDWVLLQDQSQTPGFPQNELMWMASRTGAITLHELITAGGGETVFLLTWGRRDGDATNPELFPDFSTMQQRLLDGYLAYIEAVEEDGRPRAWLAPAGLAFQRVHDDLVADGLDPIAADTVFTRLYTNDGSHPSASGSYLAALTVAAAITGRPVTGVPHPDDVDAGDVAYLQQVATDVVRDDPFGVVPYRWAFEWADWASPDDTDLSGPVVSDPVTWPVVRVAEGGQVELEQLSLGAVHAGDRRGAGSLWLQGGQLTVDGELAVGAGGDAELRMTEGGLAAGQLTLSDAGLLALWASPQRALPIGVTGEVSLAGTVRISVDGDADWGESGEQTLIQAASINAEGMIADVPEGFELRTETGEDGARLLLAWGDPIGDDDDATGDDDDTTGQPPGGDDDTGLTPGEGGCQCGCGSHRATAVTALVLPVAALGIRRRFGGGPARISRRR